VGKYTAFLAKRQIQHMPSIDNTKFFHYITPTILNLIKKQGSKQQRQQTASDASGEFVLPVSRHFVSEPTSVFK
jgi:hypothetical protein